MRILTSTTQGYRVKLFLESFGVRAALLNAELPLNSRSHILQSFNRGLFDHLIATGVRGL
jgi:ATP-dependent RNA helicase DDX56/DBP9